MEAVLNQGVTNMFASPALLNRVAIRQGKYDDAALLTTGGIGRRPVSPENISQFSLMLTGDTEIHTPYGATEAVPIVAMGSKEILSETAPLSAKGYGLCVGKPIEGLDVKIIKITDKPLPKWSDDLAVKDGDIGEISVQEIWCQPGITKDPTMMLWPKSVTAIAFATGWEIWAGGTIKGGYGFAAGKTIVLSRQTEHYSPYPANRFSINTPCAQKCTGGGWKTAQTKTGDLD